MFDAKIVAERIRKNVEEYEFPGQDKPLRVTMRLGLSQNIKNDTPKDLIKRADLALYKSKKNGRNKFTCYEEEDF